MTVNKDINKDRGDNIKRKALSSANRCSVCFTEGLTEAHHIVPVSLGGPSILSNLVELCLSCHDKVHNQRAGWREKARAGIEAAKARGVYKGRPFSLDHDKIRELWSSGMGATAISKELGCSRGAVYKTMKG